MAALDRTNPERELLDELHLLTLTFLKKLSIFKENKDAMVSLSQRVKSISFPFMSFNT